MNNEQEQTKQQADQLFNGLNELVQNLGFSNQFGQQISQTATTILNNRYYLLSNDRNTLTYTYLTHGIVQTMIDQPVEDGFRGGLDIACDEVEANDIADLQDYLQTNGIIEEIKRCIKWTRLFGGGGLVINTDGDSDKPFNINQLNQKSQLSFYGADLWELYMTNTNMYVEEKPYVDNPKNDVPYLFYGQPLHKTRVLKVIGKDAPSFLRPQLRGWGMSELERLIRDLNSYLKNQALIFELLDEAKIDIYKIKDFNSALLTSEGTNKIQNRVQLSNQIKNFQSALVMDTGDEFDQKQINFTGLAEMLNEIRKMIANSLKMPISKIFGQSITGLNGGEDDIENYNTMIESEIRNKYNDIVLQVLKLCAMKVWGVAPKSLKFTFKPLRELTAIDVENVKNQKLERILKLVSGGLMPSDEAIQQINLENLVPAKIQINKKQWFKL
jgi:phage-related protein (TIGR01555 family)